MRLCAAAALVATMLAGVACGRSDVFRQYEYEEEVFLSLDGTATVYVNASVPALDALRGASLDPAPNARFDRRGVRDFFTTSATRVTRISSSRRSKRRFVHVRMEVDDIRKLGEAAPFAWSSYHFVAEPNRYVYRQVVGPAAAKEVGRVNWTGQELIAFRLHLPSTVIDDNASQENHRRGNILVWEQPLADRLKGQPLELAVQIESESILAHTLWLFGGTALGVVAAFGFVVWVISKK